MKKIIYPLLGLFALTIVAIVILRFPQSYLFPETITREIVNPLQQRIAEANPLSIESLRKTEIPGSQITIEEELTPGANYQRYIASYQSEGNTIYALLTIPDGEKPATGFPVIIFNHGYIAPDEYQTTERYVAYVDTFARNGYVVFKSDYRGHGDSQGQARGGYGNNDYTIDVLNALESVKNLTDPNGDNDQELVVDANRIGMWGHSMGGYIILRSMVVRKDIRAGVIWAGVVASYPDLINNWHRKNRTPPPNDNPNSRGRWRQTLTDQYGTPEENVGFWNSISANSFLTDISGPVQLHHGTADTSVPVEFSETLENQMKDAGQTVELYTYDGDNHNISQSFHLAMQRSLEFFDKYVKDE